MLNCNTSNLKSDMDSDFSYPSLDEIGGLDFLGIRRKKVDGKKVSCESLGKERSSRDALSAEFYSLPSVYIIIPCYNRMGTTLRCLDRLQELNVMSWARVVVIDDASPDGTGKEVENQFSNVDVLYGDGDLWWAGGVNKGMTYALEHGAEYLVWLNDDCRPLDESSMKLLVEYAVEHLCISVGQAICPSGYFYGGAFKKLAGRGRHVYCDAGTTMPCDIFSGNAVCVPSVVVRKVGMLDSSHYPMMADADYGLRVMNTAFRAVVIGSARFSSEENISLEDQSLLLGEAPACQIWRAKFLSPKSSMYLPHYFRLSLQHWGLWGGGMVGGMLMKHLVYWLVRVIIPRKWLICWFGKRVRNWRVEL